MLTLLATLLLHWLLAYHKPVTSLVAPYQQHPPPNPYRLTAKQEKQVRQLSTAASPSDRKELTALPNKLKVNHCRFDIGDASCGHSSEIFWKVLEV